MIIHLTLHKGAYHVVEKVFIYNQETKYVI